VKTFEKTFDVAPLWRRCGCGSPDIFRGQGSARSYGYRCYRSRLKISIDERFELWRLRLAFASVEKMDVNTLGGAAFSLRPTFSSIKGVKPEIGQVNNTK
jgi:hypothetical protein